MLRKQNNKDTTGLYLNSGVYELSSNVWFKEYIDDKSDLDINTDEEAFAHQTSNKHTNTSMQ